MLAHQLGRAPQRLSRSDKHRTRASKLASGGLQLTARRRARKLDVRHDRPALLGRRTRFQPRGLYHHRMDVIARHELGYGTQAGIGLAADDSGAHRVRDRRMLKSGTDQSGCSGKAHSPLICTAREIAPPRGLYSRSSSIFESERLRRVELDPLEPLLAPALRLLVHAAGSAAGGV
jgi:hypothetical protein